MYQDDNFKQKESVGQAFYHSCLGKLVILAIVIVILLLIAIIAKPSKNTMIADTTDKSTTTLSSARPTFTIMSIRKAYAWPGVPTVWCSPQSPIATCCFTSARCTATSTRLYCVTVLSTITTSARFLLPRSSITKAIRKINGINANPRQTAGICIFSFSDQFQYPFGILIASGSIFSDLGKDICAVLGIIDSFQKPRLGLLFVGLNTFTLQIALA